MIDRAASLQPARAPKQQIPLAPCKGRGRFPAHEVDHACLPLDSAGSILGKAMSPADFWNTVKQTNKQTNRTNLEPYIREPREPLAGIAFLGLSRAPFQILLFAREGAR